MMMKDNNINMVIRRVARFLPLYLLTFLPLLWGCSSDNDNTEPSASTFVESGRPAWSVDLSGNDASPGWQDIDRSLYESWMYVTVKLQDELAAYATADDRMVVFIGSEQRTKPAAPNIYADGSVYFVMTIGGNSTDREINIRLCYWCAQLRQLFTIEEQSTFTPELPYGNTSDYMPPLLKGSKKYAIQNSLTVLLPAGAPFKATDDDMVAVFAGNECRGAGKVGKPFTVFRNSEGETLQLRYYSVQQGGVYSVTEPVTVGNHEQNTITIQF